jgi:two-component sensor histidine kinase/sensor domain CHASE-containing protein
LSELYQLKRIVEILSTDKVMQAYLRRKSLSCSWFMALKSFLVAKPRSLLGFVGGSVLITTLLLWQALIAQEQAYIHQETQLATERVESELRAGMKSRIQTLVRMSERWQRQGSIPKKQWEFEASLNVRDFKGFQAMQWVDPSLHVRWIVPLKNNEASLNVNVALEQRHRVALELASNRRDATITHSINLVQGGKGFLVDIPLFDGQNYNGFIVGIFRTQTVFDDIFQDKKQVDPGYAISVFDGNEEIYRRSSRSKHEQQWYQEVNIDLHRTIWKVRVYPTPELLAQLQSPLPEVVLFGGVLMAILLVIAVHLAQQAQLRAKQTELANQKLEKEITERHRAERLLGVRHTVTCILANAIALEEASAKILGAIGENLMWDLGELWLVDTQANVLRCVETWHSPSFKLPESESIPWRVVFPPNMGLPGQIWANSKTIWINDVDREPNCLPVASTAKKGLHSAFGFPIFSGSEIIGVITFFSYRYQQPEVDVLQMLDDISSQSGQFIERKWAETALRKAHNDLERRVEARTTELSLSNQLLTQEIDERKRVEEQIKASLKEKEVLLKEIHHRVKNNLQIISSLLKLQCASIEEKQTLAIFRESQNRIESMALIHEQLYESKDLSGIDFAKYIHNLVANLFCAYEVSTNNINFKIDISKVILDINAAIPCGLIINELIANSLKYAFPSNQKGEVGINFFSSDSKFVLAIKDDGIGFPKDLDYLNTQTLGLQLVVALTEQLEGEIELNNVQGTEFKITFSK